MAQGQEEHEGVQEEPEGISHLQLQEVSFHEFEDGATVSVLMEQPPPTHVGLYWINKGR